MQLRLLSTWIAASAIALLQCASPAGVSGAPVAQSAPPPKLVVLITIDQLRGDYLMKFGPELMHGLARLTKGGAWFVNAYQDHAITETAPGHASTLSGRFPAHTGIIANSIGVVDPDYTLIGGTRSESGASPLRFIGTTLVDWLVSKDRRSHALSVSMKDRAAILPIGRSKQDVYWYSSNGIFTASSYYRTSLPQWVKDFNARRIPFSYAGKSWNLSRDSSTYPERDDVPNENRGTDYVFPHRFPSDNDNAVVYLRTTPTMDSLTALFALGGISRTGVGRGPQTDVLAVSFSATDYIGHDFGPDSREVHENILRLDETLGWFLDSLYKLRDSASVVIALTADHGVSPIPELARERGEATGDQGMRVSLRRLVASVRAGMRAANADSNAFLYDGELVGIDRKLLGRRFNADSILSAFADAARQVRGVARVDRLADILKADFTADPVARRWAHEIPTDAGVDLVITLTRYSFWNATDVATHGSPYDQDAHVPIIFYGPGVKPGRYDGFVRTVDIGPTLAAIVGVKPTEKLDGVVLTQAIK